MAVSLCFYTDTAQYFFKLKDFWRMPEKKVHHFNNVQSDKKKKVPNVIWTCASQMPFPPLHHFTTTTSSVWKGQNCVCLYWKIHFKSADRFLFIVYYHFCQVKSIHKVKIKIKRQGSQRKPIRLVNRTTFKHILFN